MKSRPLISFIIPVRNGERTIEQTVDSIRTAVETAGNPDVEVLICDNASSDSTPGLLLKMKSDRRNERLCIRTFANTEGGLLQGEGRNTCLEYAKGQWICFVDADDLLDRYAVSVMMNTMDDESDIIYYDIHFFYGNARPKDGNGQCGSVTVFGQEEIRKLQKDCLCRYRGEDTLVSYRVLPTSGAKIYRHDFLRKIHIRYEENMVYGDDLLLNYRVLSYYPHAKKCNYAIYHYRKATGSLSHQYRSTAVAEWQRFMMVLREYNEKYYPDDPRTEEIYRFRALFAMMHCVIRGPGNIRYKGSRRKKDFEALYQVPEFQGVLVWNLIRKMDIQHKSLACFLKWRFLPGILAMSCAETIAEKAGIRY